MFSRLLLLSTLLFVAACKEKNAFAPPPPTPVGYQQPIVRDQQTYSSYPGRIEANQVVEIRARVKGILEKVGDDFDPGKKIEKDTLLFTIEKVFYLAALDAANADLAQANAGLDIAKITLDRRNQAKEAIAEIQLRAAEADVKAAEALVAMASASVMAAETDLSYCTISAPISGRISEFFVDEHNLVGNNEATLLCTIVDDSKMRVYFEADERRSLEFLRRRKGYEDANRTPPKATLSLADGTEYGPEAQIELADNRLDKDTGTLLVRATVPNLNGKLADGLFVRVKVPHPKVNEGAILIPETAIQEDIGGKFVLTVGEDNKVVRKNIKLTPDRIEGLRIVDSGLTGTEKIIVSGLQRVREGMPVAPSEVPLESAETAAETTAAPVSSPSKEN